LTGSVEAVCVEDPARDLGARHAVGDTDLQVLRERRLDAMLRPETDRQRDDEEEKERLHGAEW
jgi:hypothetical protein